MTETPPRPCLMCPRKPIAAPRQKCFGHSTIRHSDLIRHSCFVIRNQPMRSPEHILRHVIRCDWRCKHCMEVIGSERVAHYGADAPEMIKPTWFFASMSLLD